MNRKTKLAVAAPVLFLLFLLAAGLERGTHFFDFRYFQFESSLYFIVVLFLALGAFSMFALFTVFPPKPRTVETPPAPRALPPPSRSYSAILQAEMEAEMGRLSIAAAILEQVNLGSPEYGRARKMMGDLAAEQGAFEESEGYYQEAMKTSALTEKGPVMMALANLYEIEERIPMACDLYREVAKQYPDAPGPVLRLRSLSAAAGDWQEAITWQAQLEERFPESLEGAEEAATRIGLRYEFAASEFEGGASRNAQAILKNIFRITDQFTPAYVLAGDILGKMEDGSAAIRMWEKGFAATGHPVLMQRICDALLSENLPDKAVEHVQRTVRENPGRPDLEYCLGDLYLRLEMVHEAQQLFAKLHARFADWALVSRTLSELYRKTGEFRKSSDLQAEIADQDQRILSWLCYNCNTTHERYCERCHSCQQWNTVQINHLEAGTMEPDAKNTAYVF